MYRSRRCRCCPRCRCAVAASCVFVVVQNVDVS